MSKNIIVGSYNQTNMFSNFVNIFKTIVDFFGEDSGYSFFQSSSECYFVFPNNKVRISSTTSNPSSMSAITLKKLNVNGSWNTIDDISYSWYSWNHPASGSANEIGNIRYALNLDTKESIISILPTVSDSANNIRDGMFLITVKIKGVYHLIVKTSHRGSNDIRVYNIDDDSFSPVGQFMNTLYAIPSDGSYQMSSMIDTFYYTDVGNCIPIDSLKCNLISYNTYSARLLMAEDGALYGNVPIGATTGVVAYALKGGN